MARICTYPRASVEIGVPLSGGCSCDFSPYRGLFDIVVGAKAGQPVTDIGPSRIALQLADNIEGLIEPTFVDDPSLSAGRERLEPPDQSLYPIFELRLGAAVGSGSCSGLGSGRISGCDSGSVVTY
jgi:hypothetical protein